MTPDQIALIHNSFTAFLPCSDSVARAFYARWFAIAPQARALFGTDFTPLGRKLMITLTALVDSVDRPGAVSDGARELARRHIAYGARPLQYPAFHTALIETLRTELGAAWTPATEAAWTAAFDRLAGAMIDITEQAA